MSKSSSYRTGTPYTPLCDCGKGQATVEHYLLHCCMYADARPEMMEYIHVSLAPFCDNSISRKFLQQRTQGGYSIKYMFRPCFTGSFSMIFLSEFRMILPVSVTTALCYNCTLWLCFIVRLINTLTYLLNWNYTNAMKDVYTSIMLHSWYYIWIWMVNTMMLTGAIKAISVHGNINPQELITNSESIKQASRCWVPWLFCILNIEILKSCVWTVGYAPFRRIPDRWIPQNLLNLISNPNPPNADGLGYLAKWDSVRWNWMMPQHKVMNFPALHHNVQLVGDLFWGKSSALCQPTWPAQSFILLGSINE